MYGVLSGVYYLGMTNLTFAKPDSLLGGIGCIVATLSSSVSALFCSISGNPLEFFSYNYLYFMMIQTFIYYLLARYIDYFFHIKKENRASHEK